MPLGESVTDEIAISCQRLGSILLSRNQCLVTVESCTGGGIAHCITAIPGSSGWFDRALVTYSNQAKSDLAGVSEALIQRYGAVSTEVAEAMATGGLQNSQGHHCLSVTGIAGPDGGTPEKPVGTVCFAYTSRTDSAVTLLKTDTTWFDGDRECIRYQSILHGLHSMIALLD